MLPSLFKAMGTVKNSSRVILNSATDLLLKNSTVIYPTAANESNLAWSTKMALGGVTECELSQLF